jgi:hypothetical protein
MKSVRIKSIEDLKELAPNDGKWYRHQIWIKNDNGKLSVADSVIKAILDEGVQVNIDP